MFKPATSGPQKTITANRLSDGRVVFLDGAGGWSVAIDDARLLGDGSDLEAAIAFARGQQDARVVVEPYPIDLELVGDRPVPSRLRERIRAEGPTIAYGEAERALLAGGA